MKNIVDFLSELKLNNNKEWFDANKARYKAVQEEFNVFTEKLIAGIASFDKSVAGVTVKDCTYRIYRDTRFSPNKAPYKTHMGAYVCPKGKKSGYAGYYFHIEPQNADYIGGNLLAAGIHCPEPKVVKSIREEIFDNGQGFEASIKKADGFYLDKSVTLQKVPKEFPKDSEWGEYLKLKEFSLMKFFPEEILSNEKQLLDFTLKNFKKCVDFNHLLNRAVDYAYEEM